MFELLSNDMAVVGGLLALLATMAFGAVWYGPSLMGDVWAEAQGIDERKMNEISRGDRKTNITSVLMHTLMIVVVHFLSNETKCVTVNDALWLGGLLWVGFALPLAVVHHSYNPYAKKVVLLIDVSYQLVYFMLQALCVVYFKNLQWGLCGLSGFNVFGGGLGSIEDQADADANAGEQPANNNDANLVTE